LDTFPVTTAKARNQYHHGDLDIALISTARKLIKKYGLEHISLRQVAHEIGVSPSAVYHYYTDRDSLLAAVGFSLFEELADYQELKLGEITGSSLRATRERFRTLGRTYFDWAVKEPHLFNLMFSGLCLMDPKTQKNREESRAFNNLTKCLDDLLAADLMDPKMRPYGELLAWSVVHGATSLIVGGHLEPENYELILDGIEQSLGIRK
jgi:AcrR family transcriptional regulator